MPYFASLKNINSDIFITGTGTDVGKTFVSSLIASECGFAYWKPIQTGYEVEDDTAYLKWCGVVTYPSLHRFKEPLAPSLAAGLCGEVIELEKILSNVPMNKDRRLIIEGAGGVLVPISDSLLMIDIIVALNVPVIVVSKDELGTINHTLLTLEALDRRGVRVLGIVMNCYKNDSCNSLEIEKHSNVPTIAKIPISYNAK